MAQLPSALACHRSSVASSEVPLACTAKSMMVVVPPHAAARVPVSKVSAENVPPKGISMCVCTSIPPGSTYLPAALIAWSTSAGQASATSVPGAASAMIRSPPVSTSAATAPLAVMTVPPLIRIRIVCSCCAMTVPLGLDQGFVGVRAPVAVELPQVANLDELVHVQVAHHDLGLGVRGRAADKLTARVHEVRLAVEVVVPERF